MSDLTSDLPGGLDPDTVDALIEAAIKEDLGGGDITSRAVIPGDAEFSGVMAARDGLTLAGLPLAEIVFKKFSADITWRAMADDGQSVAAGTNLAALEAERTALNLVQHLSGIATLTRRYADAIAGTGAVLLDTRKTIPGLRALAKYATRMGGATNHRMGLDDGVLIKDNHIAVAGGIAAAVGRARDAGLTDIEVECDTLAQVEDAALAGADIILLDNMAAAMMRRAVDLIAGRAKTEASGGIDLDSIRAAAESGVDYVSVGRLTQSAPAADIGLDWRPLD